MSNNNNHQLGEAPWFHVALSTGFGVGFWPWGPGTLGGFVALLTWIGLYLLLLSLIHISEPTRRPILSRMPSSA